MDSYADLCIFKRVLPGCRSIQRLIFPFQQIQKQPPRGGKKTERTQGRLPAPHPVKNVNTRFPRQAVI